MDLRRLVVSLAKLSLTLSVALSLVACAGKSARDSEGDDDGDDDTAVGGGAGIGGTNGRGGTSGGGGTIGRGGSGTGGTGGGTVSPVTRINQSAPNKLDLLFMIDNSISMADKQRILAESVPVLVQRLVDPICVDGDGNPAGGTTSGGCSPNQPEFTPIKDIHIGVITSSLGNHGGQVCTPDPAEMPPRTLNDAAQLIPSMRTGVYSYDNQGFLAWDPRMGQEIPVPDPHPGKGQNETNPTAFVQQFTSHVTAAGERGCGYESSLEAWYRFLVDPEPVSQITNDGQFSIRGPINPVVLQQRAVFLRPDSLLGIVMLTDENDCSITDENGQQGWLVGSRNPFPRGSDACGHPESEEYRCCIPCVLLDVPGYEPAAGCSYGNDVSCNTPPEPTGAGGHYLAPIEDSTNLRCFDQVRRFGINLLYPWQRYVDALTTQRVPLRPPNTDEVTNPIFTPGQDGTPARDPSQVFLVGIVGVPWQDLATEDTLSGRALRFMTAQELTASGRWDVIVGDPDSGILPLDPFMIQSIDAREGTNPITGDNVAAENDIKGHEQNNVNRDDLQYACTFDLVPDVPCTMANQDGCDCNASEGPYDRPICQYATQGADGVQTHAKAYPGTRHLQVLRALNAAGDNAVVASICPKNVMANGSAASDPDYGYNPAIGAMLDHLKRRLRAGCLAREFETNAQDRLTCDVVEVTNSANECSCTLPGRAEPSDATRQALEDELAAISLCGGATGVSCSDYCLCEINGFAGADLQTCQNTENDPGNMYGYCYIDPDNGLGNPSLVESCPDTQRRILRFMGPDLPAPRASAFVVCPE